MGNPNSSDQSDRAPPMQPPSFAHDEDTDVDVDGGGDYNDEINDTDDEAADGRGLQQQTQRHSHPRQHDGGPDDGDADSSDHNGMHSDADEDDDPHPPPHQPLPSPDPAAGAPDPSLDLDDDIDQLADGLQGGNPEQLQVPAPPPPASPASSSSASSPVPAAIPRSSLEPDDPSVPCYDRTITGFHTFTEQQVRHRRTEKLGPECTPIFDLLGCRWQIDLYANRTETNSVGLYLHYIDTPGKPSSEMSPYVVFRIVVFHRDVVAETDALNAQRKAQHQADVEAQAAAAASATAQAVPAPPGDFVPLSYPANDPRNAENSRNAPFIFRPDEDFGFGGLVPHKRLGEYCCGEQQAFHFRVMIQHPPQAAGRAIRPLKSFIEEAKSGDEEKVRWPYLGLDNQGATCYMNSYLQTLFYLPAFRRAVYSLPVEASQLLELLEPSASSSTVVTTKDIPLALQHLFYTLDKSDVACNTKKLTQSFGWTAADSFQQHDVQEFSRVLLDHLESVTKDHPTLAPITRLFEGKQQMFIECTHVPYSSTRIETFLDLSLNVKGMQTLERSFLDYVAEESMDGKNQYRAVDASRGVDFGMQDARKGVRFIRFPQLLQLQLKRFEVDYQGLVPSMKKVNERLEFPLVLDLTQLEFGEREGEDDKQQQPSPSPDPAAIAAAASGSGAASPKPTRVRLPTNPRDPAIYHLQSVLVHRGSLAGGHYFAFTRPFLASLQQRARELKQNQATVSIADLDELSAEYEHSPFFKFDDETVSICKDSKAAVEMNFGGGYTELVQQLGKRMEIQSSASGNAYMLVYVRRAIVWNAGFSPMQEAAVPAATSTTAAAGADSSASSAAAAMSDVPPASLHMQPTSLPLDHSHSANAAAAAADESKVDPDFTQPQGDASMADAPAPSSAPCLQRASSMRFTETPQSLRDFVASLAPVAVPFPEHIERGIEEAKKLRRMREEEMLIKAQQFPLDVIFERDLLWQGLRDDETEAYRPEGGVAGLELTVAPAITDRDTPLPLREFLFKQPIQSLVLHKADPLSKVRAELAERYGVPAERLQLWRVTKATTTIFGGVSTVRRGCLEYLSDLHRPLSSLTALGLESSASTPLMFVRDTLPIDGHPALGRLTHEAGNPQNYARSVDPKFDTHTGHGPRQLLLFKFFDHVTQRLIYLGSGTLFKHMNVRELHNFARALLRSKGVRRPAVGEVAPTLVANFAQMQPCPAVGASTADLMTDASTAASSVTSLPGPSSGQLGFVPHMLALPSAGLAFSPSAPPDVEVLASNHPPDTSAEERRWEALRKRMTPEQQAAILTPQSIQAACLQSWPIDTPLHLEEESDALLPPVVAPPNPLDAAYKTPLSIRPKEDAAAKKVSIDFGHSLRECKLQNGSVIVISTPLPEQDLNWLQLKHAKELETYQTSTNPMAAADPTAAVLSVPSRSPKKANKRAAADSAAMDDVSNGTAISPPSFGCRSPLPLGTLSTLPVTPAFHVQSSSYLQYLLHRFVTEWKPAALDLASMQTNVFDPQSLPAHPFAQLSTASFVMEVSDADTTEQLHAQVQSRLLALLPAAVSSMYPQLSDPNCYRLWRDARVTSRPLTKPGELRTQPLVAFAILPLTAKAVPRDQACTLLEQQHPLLRSDVHRFYFELSPVSISELRSHWWFRLEFVDVRGQVLSVPSIWPGLLDSAPFLVSKAPNFSVAQFKEMIYHRFIRPNKERFTAHMPPMRFIGTPDEEAAAAAAAAAAEKEAKEKEANAKAKLKADSDAAVDMKSEGADALDIAAAVHMAAAQQQQTAGKRRFEDEDQPGQSLIKTEPDSKKQRGDASTDIASSAPSLALAAPASPAKPAAELPSVQWSSPRLYQYDPRGDNSASVSASPVHRFFSEWVPKVFFDGVPPALAPMVMKRMQAAVKVMQERVTELHTLLPARYSDALAAPEEYTHPMPFKITVYLPMPMANARSEFVYRFTTFSSAESGPAPKASYAFSPMPPILLQGPEAAFATPAAVRARLGEQLMADPASLRLAVLRPREYELLPAPAESASPTAAAASSSSASPSSSTPALLPSPVPSVFASWQSSRQSGACDLVLGLFDESTKHVLSTSQTHEVQTAAVPWLKKMRPTGLSINGTK